MYPRINNLLNQYQNIYFLGIGGVGMSGLAGWCWECFDFRRRRMCYQTSKAPSQNDNPKRMSFLLLKSDEKALLGWQFS